MKDGRAKQAALLKASIVNPEILEVSPGVEQLVCKLEPWAELSGLLRTDTA